jgi:uncharacterized protein
MPQPSILTNQQKKLLQQFLDLAEDREEAPTLTELEGFLFGLAITPDMIMPSEWMPEIFGGKMATFASKEQDNFLIMNLFEAYNAYNKESHAGTLRFPFDMKKLSDEMVDDMQAWSFGLLEAMNMRPEIWHITDVEGFENATEDVKDVILSFWTLYGFVYPDDFEELFIKYGKPVDDVDNFMEILLVP